MFARAGDDSALTEAWFATAWAQLVRCRWAAMMEAVEHALEHAQRARSARWERELPAWMGTALFYGPTPVVEVLRWYEEARAQHPIALTQQAVLEAMLGNFDRARTLAASADAIAEELGQSLWLAAGGIALLGGRDPCRRRSRCRARRPAQPPTCWKRSATPATGRLRARSWPHRSARSVGSTRRTSAPRAAEELSAVDDVSSQMLWREVRARLLARRGASDAGCPARLRGGVARRGHGHAELARAGMRRPRRGPCARRTLRRRARAARCRTRPLLAEGKRDRRFRRSYEACRAGRLARGLVPRTEAE